MKDIDCLVACKHLIDASNNPVVLNLADILVPGGCVESGSGTQEESIFRRSNITKTLMPEFYPCESFTALQCQVLGKCFLKNAEFLERCFDALTWCLSCSEPR